MLIEFFNTVKKSGVNVSLKELLDLIKALDSNLINRSTEDFLVSSGDRIAQMILVPIKQAKLRVVEDFSGTDRGTKGFGSSGVD